MIFVKVGIVLWVAFFIVRFFVCSSINTIEKITIAYTGKIKMTPMRFIMLILFISAIADSFTALIWFLFFR
jgi:hypothetical protein|nr:MAG TPA: hypothetical protein [Caudoviricetes sp.]DAT90700.1 MAG TPA: hypothetical protein [Bacteriophage sp.]